MKNLWFISDTHFNHANILSFKDKDDRSVRDFDTVQEMNELMIQRWNDVVRPGDPVYHLGDVLFGLNKLDWLMTHMPRLMGKKRLIFGNHDDPKNFVGVGHFSKTMMWRMFPEFGLLATHVPVHESTLEEKRFEGRSMINVHGHIHQNPSPKGPYVCVSVEQTEYRPVHVDEVIRKGKR